MSYLTRFKTNNRRASISYIALFFLSFLFATTSLYAQDGKAIFNTNCASCHHPTKSSTGPALQGITNEVDMDWLYSWVKNSGALIESGDKRAVAVYEEYNRLAMPPFPSLSNDDIDAIFDYVNNFSDAPAGGGGEAQTAAVEKKDSTWLYAIITIMLLILVIVLSKVNKTLKKIANDQKGIPNKKDVPLFRNKVFITLSSIVLIVLAGYYAVSGGSRMGIQKNYMPEQPIFYSHKVHAGINQINCLYCHAGAESSRQAMIPSTNVCMNCHKQIDEYTGEQLYTYEGKKVDGTAEIQKLYEYAGWDPDLNDYLRDAEGNIMAKPIEWVKIHNLPDHVYFNHAQHVSVGNVQCQTCHGPVQDMDEVYQFETLSMGWCVNCHRQTKVDFVDNDYYSIYQKYHDEIKEGTREGVTVADIGGLDCQKCHY
ncbi:MAG TPA: c-type cytochrome [Chitinophagaceae bacterium]|nr:c-type cytochrome [Chitinophagaceae bacterium]